MKNKPDNKETYTDYDIKAFRLLCSTLLKTLLYCTPLYSTIYLPSGATQKTFLDSEIAAERRLDCVPRRWSQSCIRQP